MTETPMTRPGEVAGWPKLVVTYRTDRAGIDQLLPPGLVAGEPTVKVGIYCIPIMGEPEYGISVKVPAAWNGVAGERQRVSAEVFFGHQANPSFLRTQVSNARRSAAVGSEIIRKMMPTRV